MGRKGEKEGKGREEKRRKGREEERREGMGRKEWGKK